MCKTWPFLVTRNAFCTINTKTCKVCVKIGDKMVIDPTLDEERVASARLNVGVTKDGHICSMQKGGKEPLTKDDILYCVNTAVGKVKELVEYL